ncbi:protein kinase [Planomonospora sp. ID67723]|uniref:serine/threonine-protein kinase n=1 Tax=Planomonospora sp. ID67723 TaxID=2738134 RepID=UPI0018C3ECDF|nr:serine/threonine-protein kinase [Planomonospora sp. ID67723]MBG0830019.1 protein kinase [Planomonospora sp. ID67723]
MSGMPPGVRPLTVGDPVIIGRYLLLGRLGTGGMGVVYLAEHPQGGVVALKTPHPVHLNDPTLRARFAEEVEFSRRVTPFCTAAVVEDGTDRERPYLVSEYIPGPALSQVVAARGPLTPDLAYGVALGVAGALTAVHEAGLVHRDLKPGNVLLSETGPRLIDFGIARDVDTLAAHTQAGQVMGSPGWVAPERLTGGPALPASDVFSWGCLIAYAATGHHPFGAGEPDVLTRRILVEPPRLSAVPELLRPAVEAALAREPARRPRAADLLGALLAAGGIGDPWDLREAVAEVLAEIWTPVPYPPGGGRLRLASGGSAAPADRPERPVSDRPPARRSRRAEPRRGAHLPQASFAALATVSMVAFTVVAAGNGGPGASRGGVPEHVPMVIPADGTTAGAASRGTRPPGGRVGSPPPVSPSTIMVTATRTVPLPGTTDRLQEPSPENPQGSPDDPGAGAPDDPGEPQTCADVNAKGKGKGKGRGGAKGCPTATTGPKPSFTQIPQTGDGESPSPTPTASTPGTPAATVSPTPSPSIQIGG